jgi:hypothetical protein
MKIQENVTALAVSLPHVFDMNAGDTLGLF